MSDAKPSAVDDHPDRTPTSTDPQEQAGAGRIDVAELLGALHFAADKHRDQRRKGRCASPYINHPIEVAELLVRIGGITDVVVLQAALLHDTLEDTETTAQELETRFGAAVRRLVEEVSDDKTLPREQRKRLQVEHAPALSGAARQIKLADKICNLRDLNETPPPDWPAERRRAYLDWSWQVAAGCRGVNPGLDDEFDRVHAKALARLQVEGRVDATPAPGIDATGPRPGPP